MVAHCPCHMWPSPDGFIFWCLSSFIHRMKFAWKYLALTRWSQNISSTSNSFPFPISLPLHDAHVCPVITRMRTNLLRPVSLPSEWCSSVRIISPYQRHFLEHPHPHPGPFFVLLVPWHTQALAVSQECHMLSCFWILVCAAASMCTHQTVLHLVDASTFIPQFSS